MSTEKDIELEHLKLNVEVWKKIIDVQQHFNDLEMKVRNFGLLIVSAFISAIGVSLKSQYEASIGGYSIPIASFLAFGACIVWLLVFLVDVYWYHPLLKGAVSKGEQIEKQLKEHLPNIDLTCQIGKESAVSVFGVKNVRSTTKAKIFYLGIVGVLFILALSLLFSGKERSDVNSLENKLSEPTTVITSLEKNNFNSSKNEDSKSVSSALQTLQIAPNSK
ncbi:hypothetical protein [Photobacterium leiognathi]|uniref:hypothetical protein n=1 Tax=Photobacterium leiognathi TaxID=553611 RepID=UPI0029821E5B|nr:hypothetical protein [Photobacterium leiognathi]